VRCSVLQCVCSVSQCVAVCYSALQYFAVSIHSVLQCVLQCVAMCCSENS